MASAALLVSGTYVQPTPQQLANVFSPVPPQIMAVGMTAGNTNVVVTLTNAQVQNAILVVGKIAFGAQTLTLTLPTPSAVPNAKIRIVQMCAAATTGSVLVNCTTNGTSAALFSGSVLNTAAAGIPAVISTATGTTVTFLAASIGGDWIECVSNGALWLLTGASGTVGFTFA